MGGGLVENLRAAGGEAVVFDLNPASVREVEALGAVGAASLADLAGKVPVPRVIWVMVPAGEPVDAVLRDLVPHLAPGDVVIDGGNSFYRDSVRRGEELESRGIHFLDSGTSGGIEGAKSGLCLMVGGKPEAFALAEPLFAAIAQKDGYAHVGPRGAGHFIKMVHNAIEYGQLQAMAEGFELLEEGPYDVDLAQVANLWNHGGVVRSWLMELAARAFEQEPHLTSLSGRVGGGSTGSWAIEEAWKVGVPMPAISASYMARLRSRQDDTFSGKVIAALRWQFGRHETTPTPGKPEAADR